MKKYIYILSGIALVALVIYQLASNKKETEAKVYHHDKDAPIEVEAYQITPTEMEYENTFSGTFEANKDVKVTADTQGKIEELLVDLGTAVKAGQALVKLEHSLLKLQLEAVDLKIADLENDAKRFSILKEAQAVEGVKLEKVQLGLASAKVERNILLNKISKSTVKAPFDGVITMKFTEVGAYAAPAVPLLQLTEINKLRFTVFVSEMDVDKFIVGAQHSIVADNDSLLVFQGKTIAVGSQSNPGGSYPVQFLVNNTADHRIRSGMFGKVKMKRSAAEKGIYISSSILQGSEAHPFVYKIIDGKAVLKSVVIKKKVKDKLMISDGINAGDILISKGFVNLFEGANVIISE